MTAMHYTDCPVCGVAVLVGASWLFERSDHRQPHKCLPEHIEQRREFQALAESHDAGAAGETTP